MIDAERMSPFRSMARSPGAPAGRETGRDRRRTSASEGGNA